MKNGSYPNNSMKTLRSNNNLFVMLFGDAFFGIKLIVRNLELQTRKRVSGGKSIGLYLCL